MKGFSVMFCIGKPAGLRVEHIPQGLRIVLGPLAFWIAFFDMDMFIGETLKQLKEETSL